MNTSENRTVTQSSPAVKSANLPENIVIEVDSGDDGLRHFVVPYDEWTLIREWYSNPDQTGDYFITLPHSQESCRIVRLDKKSLEIKALGLSQSSVVSKNISYVLFSPLHRALKFSVAFFISMSIWIIFTAIALVRGTKLTYEFTQPVMKLTTVVFVIFLLLNIEAGIIKAVDIAKNKFKAFMIENEIPFTDTLAFNFALLFIFSIWRVEGIVNLIKKLMDFMGI